MKRQQGFTVEELFQPLIIAIGLWGYFWNIVKIIGAWQLHQPITGLFILRCIGVLVPPLGVIMGFFY
jgi:hypothetical protein